MALWRLSGSESSCGRLAWRLGKGAPTGPPAGRTPSYTEQSPPFSLEAFSGLEERHPH